MGVEDSSSDVAVLHSPSSRWGNSVRLAAESTLLDPGFLDLYNLDFAGAQKNFAAWETQHPDDPVGPVGEAAGYLFSEFKRLGVFESFYRSRMYARRMSLKQ